jgi:hypothetical protein
VQTARLVLYNTLISAITALLEADFSGQTALLAVLF